MSLISRCSKLTESSSSSSPSILTLLNACKTFRNLEHIHTQIIQRGIEQDHIIISRFITLCNSLSSNIAYATSVFDRVIQPNIYLWNTLIKGYTEHSSLDGSVSIFVRMKRNGTVVPDKFTFPSLLKACSNELALKVGRAIHGSIVRHGTDGDVFVGSSLIDFYGKCREINCALKVFNAMSVRNVVSWTAMIVGFVNVGDLGQAKRLFDEMPIRNHASWNAMISAVVRSGDLRGAKKLFDEMPIKNVVSFTVMIDGYAKAGDMAMARFLFDQSPNIDIVAWSALISGYTQNGNPNEAVKLFVEMDSRNLKPDEYIMVNLMSACSQIGCLELAKWVDSYVSRSSINLRQAHVSTTLLDMNAKCGNMERATILFEQMPKRDLVSYCSMIQGLSIHGHGVQAVGLFARMLNEGLTPDDVAFTVILTACSHAGLVEEGCRYFDSMIHDYSLVPSPDHYGCIIDLLARSGNVKAAYELIKSMPVAPHAGAWGALLGACKLHCNVELGEEIANHLFQLEPCNAGNYVLLSDIYAAADRWLDVSLLRNRMKERGIRKIPGRSWL
ncbi:putative pentatricopeptide repeat-containing protein At5g37570 [Cornus florida]|uniref:putative pentatricopeptide repeat-containing protein At5g37570 n=1 Tax=Cornus florida TaxID=4283 RepID=UPI002896399C|nr:putative pentatricopeptide repeat-containing protein At5g37570 [Cornus florida]